MSKLHQYILVFVFTALVCFLVSCSIVDAQDKVKNASTESVVANTKVELMKEVQVIKPEIKSLSVTIEEGVTLAPEEIGSVTAEITAVLKKWNVEENQKVKKGEVIADLDPIDYQINLEQAKANYAGVKAQFASVEKDYYRMKSLVESGNVPQQQFDAIEGQYKAMQAQLQAMENGLKLIKRKVNKSRIRAPFDGVISKKLVPLGNFIMISMPGSGDVAQIEKIDRLKASINISEMFFNEIDNAEEISFFVPSLNQKVEGKISSKGKSINALKQFSVISYIDNKDNSIPAGVYAMAVVKTKPKERTIVPATAVKNLGNRLGEVYSVVDDKIVAHQIVIGFPFETGMEISGDIPQTIIKDLSNVRVGEKVKAIQPRK